MIAQTFQEKRRYYRHPISMPIQYREASARKPDRSSSVDLSEGGVCFLGSHFLARGTRLDVTIPVGDQLFKINGQVAYCNRIASLDRFRVGVAFSDPSNIFRAKLATQMYEIGEYRKRISQEAGRDVPEDEAARQWIEKYAQLFSSLF